MFKFTQLQLLVACKLCSCTAVHSCVKIKHLETRAFGLRPVNIVNATPVTACSDASHLLRRPAARGARGPATRRPEQATTTRMLMSTRAGGCAKDAASLPRSLARIRPH